MSILILKCFTHTKSAFLVLNWVNKGIFDFVSDFDGI
jgi:hypothetical protein